MSFLLINTSLKYKSQEYMEQLQEGWTSRTGLVPAIQFTGNQLICKIFESSRCSRWRYTCHEREIKVHRANKVSILRCPPPAHTYRTRTATTRRVKYKYRVRDGQCHAMLHASRGQRLMVAHKARITERNNSRSNVSRLGNLDAKCHTRFAATWLMHSIEARTILLAKSRTSLVLYESFSSLSFSLLSIFKEISLWDALLPCTDWTVVSLYQSATVIYHWYLRVDR